jgi:Tfp pilus assembly protein PilZ
LTNAGGENRIICPERRRKILKRILIGDCREDLLSTLEVILKNWGYRALCTSEAGEFLSLLDELAPDILLVGPSIVTQKNVAKKITDQKSPLILLEDPQIKPLKIETTEHLAYPVNVFRLFELVQKSLEKIPRRNIRLKVQLPSMYYHGDAPCIAEIVSISTEGIFIRTGSRIEGLDEVRIVLPLIGMQTEIEVDGRIVYRVDPQQENNYVQGMGIEFKDVDSDTGKLLQQFVESLLVAELTEKSYIQDSLDLDQLQKYTDDLMLKIHPAS